MHDLDITGACTISVEACAEQAYVLQAELLHSMLGDCVMIHCQ